MSDPPMYLKLFGDNIPDPVQSEPAICPQFDAFVMMGMDTARDWSEIYGPDHQWERITRADGTSYLQLQLRGPE